MHVKNEVFVLFFTFCKLMNGSSGDNFFFAFDIYVIFTFRKLMNGSSGDKLVASGT